MVSDNIKLKIVSLSVQGLRSAIITWLQMNKKGDSVFLQETYSTKEVENFWSISMGR